MNFFIPIVLLLAVSAYTQFSYAGNGTPPDSCVRPPRPMSNNGVLPGAAMNDIVAASVSVFHDQILNLFRQVQGILHHESQILADFKDRIDQAVPDPSYCSLNRSALLKTWEERVAAIRLMRGMDQGLKSLRDQLYSLNHFSLDLAAAELEYGSEWCQVEELVDDISRQVMRIRTNFLPICSFPEGRRAQST